MPLATVPSRHHRQAKRARGLLTHVSVLEDLNRMTEEAVWLVDEGERGWVEYPSFLSLPPDRQRQLVISDMYGMNHSF